MRELICTVSGQYAETTKNHYIRISNDRQNYPGYGESDKLSHQGYGQKDLLESREGFSRSFDHVQVPKSGVQAEAGRTPGTGPAASSDGRDSRVKFPVHVPLILAAVLWLAVYGAWHLGHSCFHVAAELIKMAVTR